MEESVRDVKCFWADHQNLLTELLEGRNQEWPQIFIPYPLTSGAVYLEIEIVWSVVFYKSKRNNSVLMVKLEMFTKQPIWRSK